MAGDFGGRSVAPETPITDSERTWGIIAHLSPIAGALVGVSPAGPFVVWLLKKQESPYVARQAMEALAFTIGTYLAIVITGFLAGLLMCIAVGVLLLPVILIIAIAHLFYMIIAAIKASDGLIYEYPVTSKFVKGKA